MIERKPWRLKAALLAGALIASAAPAHAGRDPAATASAAQDDQKSDKQRQKDEKNQRKADEKARHKEEKAKEKEDKKRQKAEEHDRKQREKDERKAEKRRRRDGDQSTPIIVPVPASPRPAPQAPRTPSYTATPGLAPRDRLARAVDLLQQGQEGQARAELAQLLRDEPDSREAHALQDTLDSDPQALFGSESFAYKVGPRDTLITLAIEYFGDSYKFYGLARFNHIAVPAGLKPGDTILIPGHARAPIVRRPPREDEHGPAPAAAATPQPTRPAPVQPRTDPARAQRLRRAGLERMSGGSIDQAVSLLDSALRLDPGNAAIAADLSRARRIQSVVHRR